MPNAAARPSADVERGPTHLVGNSCCTNVWLILQCEPAWRRKPLGACCFCIGPLRWASFLAAATTVLFSFFFMLPVFAVLRGMTFFKDEDLADVAQLPASVLMLRHLYFLFLVWTILTGGLAMLTLVVIMRKDEGTPITYLNGRCPLTCSMAPPLVLSRVLRLGAYLFFLAFFMSRMGSHNLCLSYAVSDETAAYSQACACKQNNASFATIGIPDENCRPKEYVLCEAPAVNLTRNHALEQRCAACGLDGDVL